MKQKTKSRLFSSAAAITAVFLLAALLRYGKRLSLIYNPTDSLARLNAGEPVKLKEMPAKLTVSDWDAAGVLRYDYAGALSQAEGEFVPFRIWGKKDAYRAALACADLIGLDDGSALRYSYADSNFYDSLAPFWMGWHYYAFLQYHGELPVFESGVIVRAERFGKPAQLMVNLVRDIPDDLPEEPKITAEKAKRAAAKAFLSEPVKNQHPVLAIAADEDGGAVLAWIIALEDTGEYAVIDAVSGEAVKRESEYNYLSATAE